MSNLESLEKALLSDEKINSVVENIDTAIQSGNDNAIVLKLLELEEEKEAIDLEIGKIKQSILETMKANNVKSIKHKLATVTLVERKNIKVDEDNAWEFLDSQNLGHEFRKLDKAKFIKMWPQHELISEGIPTEYIQVKEVK